MVHVDDVRAEGLYVLPDPGLEDVGQPEFPVFAHGQQRRHPVHVFLVLRLVLVAWGHDQQFIAKPFQPPPETVDGDGNTADKGQVVVGEHGDPKGLFQPGGGVQVVIRVVVLADEDDLVQLDGNGREYRNDQDEVEVAGVEQRVDEEPEALQGAPDRMLADLQSLQVVGDVAIRAYADFHVVIEAGLVVQHQPSGAPGGDELRAFPLLTGENGQVRGEHHVDALGVDQLKQRLPEFRWLQVVVFLVEQRVLLRLQWRVADEQDAGVAGILGEQVAEPADLPAPRGLAGAVQEDQPGVAGADAVEVRAEMVVEPEAAEVIEFVGAEGQQVGDLQVVQGAVQGPVLVLATATDGIARRNHEIQPGAVQLRNDAFLENADGVIDVTDHGKVDRFTGFDPLVDTLHLGAVQTVEVLHEQVEVGLVAHQQNDDQQAQIEQQLERVSEDHPDLLRSLVSSL